AAAGSGAADDAAACPVRRRRPARGRRSRRPGRAGDRPRGSRPHRPGAGAAVRAAGPGRGPGRAAEAGRVELADGLAVCVVVGVALREAGPLLRELILGEARINRARLDAGIAVDALFGVDIEHLDVVVVRLVGGRVDAVDGADFDAGVVLGS